MKRELERTINLREVHKVCNSMFSDMCKVYGSDNPLQKLTPEVLNKNIVVNAQMAEWLFMVYGAAIHLLDHCSCCLPLNLMSSAPIFRAKCTFTHILKISGENIEKRRRRTKNVFSEAHFWNIANWDIGDFVHFWLFFTHFSSYRAGNWLRSVIKGYQSISYKATFIENWYMAKLWAKTMKFGGRAHIWRASAYGIAFWLALIVIPQPFFVQFQK